MAAGVVAVVATGVGDETGEGSNVGTAAAAGVAVATAVAAGDVPLGQRPQVAAQ